ncbi:ATP synthase F1 subunit epsilon [bacterium]|nr:ATP synthase F1 subunit epsilon [bacterium]
MKLTVLTPLKKLVENIEVDEVFTPGVEGTLDVFPHHANFLTELETGVLKWRQGEKWSVAAMSFGWLEVFDENITVLADVAELSDKIDLTRAQAAEASAKAKLQEGGLDDSAFRKTELKLQRAMARQEASH